MQRFFVPIVATLCLVVSACSSSSNNGPAAGGKIGPGGATSSGGLVAAGGSTVVGGGSASSGTAATGGGSGGITTGSGGTTPTGGTAAGSGGNAPTGGTAAGSTGTTLIGGATAGSGGTTGGTSAAGGATGTGGATPPAVTCTAVYAGSATRPQLTDASGACFTTQNYLAEAGTIGALVRDNWDPSAGLPASSSYTPTYTVAADGSGTHTTVQDAITAASGSGSSARVYILVKPGSYRELVCVKGSVPITLYGADTDATKVSIAFDNYNGKTVDSSKTNACSVPTGTSYGTSGSSTFFISAAGFQAQNLTIANDFAEGALTANIQAVALTVQGDQDVFQNVRLVGNQDTLQVKSSKVTIVARSYFKNSTIEGDTDFIFGRGTAVFDGCTITYVSSRKTDSTMIAPSTETANPFGFLIINSKMVGDSGMPTGTAYLGRAWDDSTVGAAPNGQAVIRDTEIGGLVRMAAPWAIAATSGRAFSASGNRLYEYQNTGLGAAVDVGGGAAADGGATGDVPANQEADVGAD
jgi:pectinesterase